MEQQKKNLRQIPILESIYVLCNMIKAPDKSH